MSFGDGTSRRCVTATITKEMSMIGEAACVFVCFSIFNRLTPMTKEICNVCLRCRDVKVLGGEKPGNG